jgi:hypothetical protein
VPSDVEVGLLLLLVWCLGVDADLQAGGGGAEREGAPVEQSGVDADLQAGGGGAEREGAPAAEQSEIASSVVRSG